MPKYKIEYYKKKCIGAGVCEAVNPEHWEMEDSGKAKLIESKLNEQTNMYEKTVDSSQLDGLKKAAEGCPKNVIHITNLETGEKLI